MHSLIHSFLLEEVKRYNKSKDPRKLLRELSEEIRQTSKRCILLTIKSQSKEVKGLFSLIEKLIKQAEKLVKTHTFLFDNPGYRSAIEEYLEAWLLFQYISGSTITSIPKFQSVDREVYFGALSDFTGELVRMAVIDATAGDITRIVKIRELVEQLIIDFTRLEVVSGGYLRQKIEQLDKNLRKIEDIMYTVTVMRGR